MADHYNSDSTTASHTKGKVRGGAITKHSNRTYALLQVCFPSGGTGQCHCHRGVVGVPSR